MKRSLITLAAFLVPFMLISLTGCEDSPADPNEDSTIVGTWVANGTDIAVAYQGTYQEVEVEFESDMTFHMHGDGAEIAEGTYATEGSSSDPDIRSITVTAAGTVAFSGIYRVTGVTLELELAPTGMTAPTPETGFNTSGNYYMTLTKE